MPSKRHNQLIRKRDNAMLTTFAIAHENGAMLEVNVLDPQVNTLHQPKTGTVEQARHKPLHTTMLTQIPSDFLGAEHHRKSLRPFRPNHPCQRFKGALQYCVI